MSEAIVNQQELRVIGMSRSGNHAVLNWILAQAEGRVCFLNCAEPKTNPFHSARPWNDALTYRVNYPDFDLQREQQGQLSRKDYLVFSHEDVFLGMVGRGEFERQHDQMVGRSARRVDVLILRDAFNLFASRLRFGYSAVSPATSVRIWKQHAREVLGRCRYLRQERVVILYNEWISSRAYRQRVAEQLGLSFTDAGLDEIPATGGGSSFDGLERRASSLRRSVLRRWRRCASDRSYRQLFDAELVELSDQIFGRIPGTESLAAEITGQRSLQPAP